MLKAFIKDAPFGLSIILLILAVGLIALIAPVGGNKALIVRSGSMQPAINVGDLITVKPQHIYKTGDIASFKDAAKPEVVVTHRVVGQKIQEGKVFYETKGDANQEADFNLVPKENIIGRADLRIKGVGKFFAIIKTKNGFLATAVVPAAIVILLEITNVVKEIRKEKNNKRSDGRIKSFYEHYGKPMGLPPYLALLPILATFLIIGSTYAFSRDVETSIGNIFQAAASFSSPDPLQSPIPSPSPSPSPSVNEFMAHPSSDNNEWVEFYNPGSLDLSGYWLDDDTSFADDASTSTIKSMSSINASNPQHPYLEYSGSFLNNAGDHVVLFASDGTLVNQYQYTSDPGSGISVGRLPDGTGTFQNCTTPTKGSSNNASC